MRSKNRNMPIVRQVASEFGLTIDRVVETGKHVQIYLSGNNKQVRLSVRHGTSKPDYLRDWLRQNVRRAMRG